MGDLSEKAGEVTSEPSPNHRERKKIVVICRFRPSASELDKATQAEARGEAYSYDSYAGFNDRIRFEQSQEPQHDDVAVVADGSWTRFTFDKVFRPSATQVDVYGSVEYIVISVMQGYNGTCLLYGQTGSGKTHTVDGPSVEHTPPPLLGIIPRAIDTLFNEVACAGTNLEFRLSMTYIEVLKEKVRDLLNPASENLLVVERGGQVVVDGAREVSVENRDEVLALLRDGRHRRVQAKTAMNNHSSRSHSLLTIIIGSHDTATGRRADARLVIVDLAGSERTEKMLLSGKRFEESKKINQSLSTLGRVIRILGGREKAAHVPYRDSTLTRVLQESLGGNSKTALIVCCAPDREHAAETLSTLRFGEVAKSVEQRISVNVQPGPQELLHILKATRAENLLLRRRIRWLEESNAAFVAASAGNGTAAAAAAVARVEGVPGTPDSGGAASGSSDDGAIICPQKRLLERRAAADAAERNRSPSSARGIAEAKSPLSSVVTTSSRLGSDGRSRSAIRAAAAGKRARSQSPPRLLLSSSGTTVTTARRPFGSALRNRSEVSSKTVKKAAGGGTIGGSSASWLDCCDVGIANLGDEDASDAVSVVSALSANSSTFSAPARGSGIMPPTLYIRRPTKAESEVVAAAAVAAAAASTGAGVGATAQAVEAAVKVTKRLIVTTASMVQPAEEAAESGSAGEDSSSDDSSATERRHGETSTASAEIAALPSPRRLPPPSLPNVIDAFSAAEAAAVAIDPNEDGGCSSGEGDGALCQRLAQVVTRAVHRARGLARQLEAERWAHAATVAAQERHIAFLLERQMQRVEAVGPAVNPTAPTTLASGPAATAPAAPAAAEAEEETVGTAMALTLAATDPSEHYDSLPVQQRREEFPGRQLQQQSGRRASAQGSGSGLSGTAAVVKVLRGGGAQRRGSTFV